MPAVWQGSGRAEWGVGTKYSMEEGNLSRSHDLHCYSCASACSKIKVTLRDLIEILTKMRPIFHQYNEGCAV